MQTNNKDSHEVQPRQEEANDFVTIPKAEYKQLKDAAKVLQALDEAGVNNWEGYEFALEIMAP